MYHRQLIRCQAADSSSEPSTETSAPEKVTAAVTGAASSGNGTGSGLGSSATTVLAKAAETNSSTNSKADTDKDAPKHKDWAPDASTLTPLRFSPLSDTERGWTNFKLLFALPWRRFKKEAVLTFKLEGEISDQLQGRFSPGFSMPQIIDALEKAAVDPRIKGIAVEINPLAVSGTRSYRPDQCPPPPGSVGGCCI